MLKHCINRDSARKCALAHFYIYMCINKIYISFSRSARGDANFSFCAIVHTIFGGGVKKVKRAARYELTFVGSGDDV